MAQEAPNVLHAAGQFDGTGGAPVISNSRGIIAATASKTGPGAYLLPLVDPVDPTAANCAISAADAGGQSLIASALVVIPAPGVYAIGILTLNAAGVATDALNCQITLTKFATDD